MKFDRVIDQCMQEAEHIGDEQLYEVTNGHDLCQFLGAVSSPLYLSIRRKECDNNGKNI